MNQTALYRAVEELITQVTGKEARIGGSGGVGGGCINTAEVVRLKDGRRFFVKSNPAPLPQMFEREAEGLAALAKPGVIRVPRPLGTGGGQDGIPPFIVMEYIETGQRNGNTLREFGRQFARLHQETRSTRFGFEHDNYLGSTPQPNGWMDDWVEFWRERRLGFQLELARKNKLSDPRMEKAGEQLMTRLDEVIGQPAEPACLLHGDLWGGNYLIDSEVHAVLIDPAAYYGRREADLAMTLLFGNFGSDFYQGYEEVWPLADGSKTRLDIYKLYHLLNHLNLFGTGYRSGCMQILERYA